jgi:5-methylcytosine-specific restriction endonuclease McrA
MPYKDLERQHEYQRQWLAERRAEWFNGKCCVLCSSTEGLELDHLDPTKKISHRIWSWSAQRREAELAKCRILCRQCHKDKSSKEKAKGEHNGKALLKAEDIPSIRTSSESRKTLAERYGVDEETIKSVRARRSWKHI